MPKSLCHPQRKPFTLDATMSDKPRSSGGRSKHASRRRKSTTLAFIFGVGFVSIILVIAFVFIATRVQLSLKVIDFAGFVGVLLFFQWK